MSGRDYDYALFGNRVINAGFPDHHSPPLGLMWSLYSIIDFWLAFDEQNVIVVHCLAGKGRTGMTIICTLLMQGFFNTIQCDSLQKVNVAINYFHDKRGDGVENPDQIRFIHQFIDSMNSMGADVLLLSSQKLQPTVYISDLILYNLVVGVGGVILPRLQIFLKSKNRWDIVYNSEWNVLHDRHITTFQPAFVITVMFQILYILD